MLFQKKLKLFGAEIGQHMAAGYEGRRARLSGEPDHFAVADGIALDVDFLVKKSAMVEVALGGDTPRTPCFDIQFENSRHLKR